MIFKILVFNAFKIKIGDLLQILQLCWSEIADDEYHCYSLNVDYKTITSCVGS